MVMIPGYFIAWLTFPGIIVHEAAHMLFCRLFGVAIFDVRSFRFTTEGAAGYVLHERVDNFKANFFIATGPLLINTFLCFIFCFPAYLPMAVFDVGDPMAIFFAWLGISIGMHAFPSNTDAQSLLDSARNTTQSVKLVYLCYPFVWLIHAGNFLRQAWFDAVYAGVVGFFLPSLVVKLVCGPAAWSVTSH